MAFKNIKLISLSHTPERLIKSVHKGSQYQLKQLDLKTISQKLAVTQVLTRNVVEIDNFNESKDLMPNWKQVQVQYRKENYTKNVGKYTEPLLLSKDWNNKMIGIVNDVWEVLYQQDVIQLDHPMFTRKTFDDDEWVYNGNPKEFEQKYDLPFLVHHLKKWSYETDHNFYPLLVTIGTLKRFNVTDYSAIGYLLTTKRNNLANAINDNVKMIKNDIEMVNFFKKLSRDIKKGIPLHIIFPPYDFDRIFPYDKSGAWWMDSMHRVIVELGAVEFIKNSNGNIYSYFNSHLGHQISNHPSIEKCGHTGFTFSWCIGNLRVIYKDGWNSWVNQMHSKII